MPQQRFMHLQAPAMVLLDHLAAVSLGISALELPGGCLLMALIRSGIKGL